ncbi:glutamate-gated chloride channel-like [Branchiostoma floridae]|uniref:Glutamate-gated chloride channel-like n=1 Tax=Branchiostoma floridae TaxID=7739 RepID=A0A9J7MAG3_BRAFL|nr:glutamate-gated chloride channel-like [Branchiostoma floridae]
MTVKSASRNLLLLLLLIHTEATSGETIGKQKSDDVEDEFRSSKTRFDGHSTLPHVIRIPEDYDNTTRPSSSVVDIGCAAYIASLGPFLERSMKFEISFYLYCQWTDPRLNISAVIAYVDETDRKIWRPQIWPDPMSGAARADFFDKPYVTPGGLVMDGLRYTIEATCLMTFYNYPHDKQFCNVPIYLRGGVVATWKLPPLWVKTDSAISINMQRVRSMFRLDHMESLSYIYSNMFPEETCIYQKDLCNYEGSESCYRSGLRCSEAENQNNALCIKCNMFGGRCKSYKTPNCSSVIEKVTPLNVYLTTLEFRFKFTRRLSYHLLKTYVPSFCVVGMSWVSFWIDPSSAPARTGLGVTTVLTIVTLSGKVEPAPELNYIRAIDVWMLGCKLFVILALLEYACVNFTVRTQTRKIDKILDGVHQQSSISEGKPEVTLSAQEEHGNETSLNDQLTQLANKRNYSMDHVSRVLFPAAYFVFVCTYFVAYMY